MKKKIEPTTEDSSIAEYFYSEPLTEDQIKELENNLYGFVKALFQIDQRLKNEQKENGTEK